METKNTNKPVEKFTGKFKNLKIQDPIALIFVLLCVLMAYFYFFPSNKKKELDPHESFAAKLEEKTESDAIRAERERSKLQGSLDRFGENMQGSVAYQEQQRQKEFLEKKNRELESQIKNAQEGFPKRRLREEIMAKSYYAPIDKAKADPQTLTSANSSSGPGPNGAQTQAEKRQNLDYFRDHSMDEVALAAQDPATPKQIELRAGTWIPAILNGDIAAQLGGHQRATIREDVIDPTGQWIVIPKGSTAIVQMAQGGKGDAYHLSALAVKEIILPNGQVQTIPIPVHDSLGSGGLDPRKDGMFKRHYMEKIGMTALIAAISAAPSLAVSDSTDVGELAQFQFLQNTGNGLQGILRNSLNIPNEKIFQAGAHLNFFLLDSILIEPYQAVYADPNSRVRQLESDLENLNKRMFQYQQQASKTLKKLDEQPSLSQTPTSEAPPLNLVQEFSLDPPRRKKR